MLLNRPLLASINYCYTFIQAEYDHTIIPWPSVCCELKRISSLLIFAQCDLTREWEPGALCSDASLSGYAVCRNTRLSASQAEQVGRFDERWRFARTPGVAPRDSSLDANVLHDISTVIPDVNGQVPEVVTARSSFPEVPFLATAPSDCKQLWAAPLFSHDPINLKEAHAMLAGTKHLSRNALTHGKRYLFLSDSMCCTLAFAKGRCYSPALLRYCQRIAAEVLATGLVVSWRWIASERNVADAGSRTWEHLRAPLVRGLGDSAAHAARRQAAGCGDSGHGSLQPKSCCPATPTSAPQHPCEPRRLGGARAGRATDFASDTPLAETSGYRRDPVRDARLSEDTGSVSTICAPPGLDRVCASPWLPRCSSFRSEGACHPCSLDREVAGEARSGPDASHDVLDDSSHFGRMSWDPRDDLDGQSACRLLQACEHAVGVYGSPSGRQEVSRSTGLRLGRRQRLRVSGQRECGARRQAGGSAVGSAVAVPPT